MTWSSPSLSRQSREFAAQAVAITAAGIRARPDGAGRNRTRSSRPRRSAAAPRPGRSPNPARRKTAPAPVRWAIHQAVHYRGPSTPDSAPGGSHQPINAGSMSRADIPSQSARRNPGNGPGQTAGLAPAATPAAIVPSHLPGGVMSATNANPYLALGVRPFINCCSVRTMHGGSLMLPQVRAAIDAASRQFVNLDELMEAAGAAPRRADRRRMGHRHLRQRRRGGARHRRLRRRQRPGQDAAPAVYRRHGQPRHHPGEAALRL